MLALVELYQAGTDATFNQAVNDLFTSQERTKLGEMITALDTLLTSWEGIAGAILTEDLNT